MGLCSSTVPRMIRYDDPDNTNNTVECKITYDSNGQIMCESLRWYNKRNNANHCKNYRLHGFTVCISTLIKSYKNGLLCSEEDKPSIFGLYDGCRIFEMWTDENGKLHRNHGPALIIYNIMNDEQSIIRMHKYHSVFGYVFAKHGQYHNNKKPSRVCYYTHPKENLVRCTKHKSGGEHECVNEYYKEGKFVKRT